MGGRKSSSMSCDGTLGAAARKALSIELEVDWSDLRAANGGAQATAELDVIAAEETPSELGVEVEPCGIPEEST